MPAAMESSQNVGNPLEISIFSLNFFENVFFFLEISGNLPGSRESAPRSRRPGSESLGPAEILQISPPRKIGPGNIFYRQIFFWWDGSFRSRWFRMFLNFSPISILLNRMAILSAAVPPTPPTGSLARTLGVPLIRGSPNLVGIDENQ